MRNLLKKYCSNIRQRWVFAVMCFLGLFHAYAMRACLSITLTEMVMAPHVVRESLDDSCQANTGINRTIIIEDNHLRKKYDWDEELQGLVLSSFYWTYVISHVPGGILAERYGGKHTLGLGVLISAVFTLLTPLLTMHGGATGMIIARVFIGLGQGVTYPTISVLLSQWVPPLERSRTGSFVYAAQSLGTIFANIGSAMIIHHTGMIRYVFYILGGLSVAWYFFWLILCYSNPREHPFISDDELNYLNEHVDKKTCDKSLPIPWRHILTSKAVWAAMVGTFGFDWITLTIMTDLPKYVSSVLKIPVKDNGLMNSLVFLSMWIGSVVTSSFADYAIARQCLSTTNVRKIGSVLTLFCSACFVVGASYVGCDQLHVTVMFTLAIGFTGAAFPSMFVNTMDLSPNFSGIIMALTNGISTGVSGIVSPYLIGIMTPDQKLSEWRNIFWIMFVVAVMTNVVFLLYGKGEVEYWNDPDFKNLKKKKKTLCKQLSTSSNVTVKIAEK